MTTSDDGQAEVSEEPPPDDGQAEVPEEPPSDPDGGSEAVGAGADGSDLASRAPGATARERARRERRGSLKAWFFDAHTGERTWRAAAKGEREVGRRLRKLEPGWLVVHSVPLGEDRSDIDHLVIGPAGVFTLNTKNLLGARVDLAQQLGFPAVTAQPQLHPADAGEQPHHVPRRRHSTLPHAQIQEHVTRVLRGGCVTPPARSVRCRRCAFV